MKISIIRSVDYSIDHPPMITCRQMTGIMSVLCLQTANCFRSHVCSRNSFEDRSQILLRSKGTVLFPCYFWTRNSQKYRVWISQVKKLISIILIYYLKEVVFLTCIRIPSPVNFIVNLLRHKAKFLQTNLHVCVSHTAYVTHTSY